MMVYNTKDFEAFLLLYKAEGAPRNISIETLCKRNGINYDVFYKWYKSVHKKIIPIEIENSPEEFLEVHKSPPYQAKHTCLKITIETEDGTSLSNNV